VVFILGIVIGFMLGAKATRDEIALGQRRPRSARRAWPSGPRAGRRSSDTAEK
jgi:hypothetical protein